MADVVAKLDIPSMNRLKRWAGTVDKRYREMRRDLLTPLGDYLVAGIQRHFDEGGVDGKAWKPLARATVERKMGQAQITAIVRARRRLQGQHGQLPHGLLVMAAMAHRQVEAPGPKAGLLSFVDVAFVGKGEGEQKTVKHRRDKGLDLLSPQAERPLRKKIQQLGSGSQPSHLTETGKLKRSIKRKTLMDAENKGTLLVYSDDPKAARHNEGLPIDHPGASGNMIFHWTNKDGESGLWRLRETSEHTIRIPRRRFMAWDKGMQEEALARTREYHAAVMGGTE